METRRAESFSDGVFAVAITVLVFNLLPIARHGITFDELANAWPQYAGYVVSFLTIGIMWLNHHTLMAQLAKVDRVALVINTFLLMGVVAVPFPTALVADNLALGTKVESERLAAVVYGLLLIAISIAFSGMWMYVAANQARLGNRRIRTPLEATIRFSAGLLGYIAGTLVAAFGSPYVALAIYAGLAVYYLFDHLPDPTEGDLGQPGAAGADEAPDHGTGPPAG